MGGVENRMKQMRPVQLQLFTEPGRRELPAPAERRGKTLAETVGQWPQKAVSLSFLGSESFFS